jgi:hypothetical protein
VLLNSYVLIVGENVMDRKCRLMGEGNRYNFAVGRFRNREKYITIISGVTGLEDVMEWK